MFCESPIVRIINGMWHRQNEGRAQGSSLSHVMSPGGGTVGRSSTLRQPHLEPSPAGPILSTFYCFYSFSSFLDSIHADVHHRLTYSVGLLLHLVDVELYMKSDKCCSPLMWLSSSFRDVRMKSAMKSASSYFEGLLINLAIHSLLVNHFGDPLTFIATMRLTFVSFE